MNERATTSAMAGIVACLVLLAASLNAGATPALPSVRDRSVPDLDQRQGAVLDLTSGELTRAPRPASFADVEEYKTALARLGDVAYEDAQGGMLFVASGFAMPLGAQTPGPGALRGLDRRLEARTFLRQSELEPGAWFAVRTRAGALSVGRVVARTGTAIRLAWSPPQASAAPPRAAWIEAIAALRPPRIEKTVLPPLGEAEKPVLSLADGRFRTGPPLAEPLSNRDRNALLEAVGKSGDLAYLGLRAGRLIVASGKVARLGTGPIAALAGRDLRERLRERPFVSASALTPGSVMLIETAAGRYALVRVDAVSSAGLRISWLLQPDGSARFPDLAAFDASFETPGPQVLDALLVAAASRGDSAELQRLLAMGADSNATRGTASRPALVHAAIQGDAGTIALLLVAGADPAGTGDDGWNALHVAAKLGRTDVVEALLAAGGDAQAQTLDGADALQLALAAPDENLDMIRLLRQQPGTTDTLSLAARVGDVAALRWMLAQGAEVDLPDPGGQTPLAVAAGSGHAAAVRALLAGGADPSLESDTGRSALVSAVTSGHVETVAVLIEHGGSTESQKNSALYRANVEGSAELARVLLDGGANADELRGESLTPLDYALRYGGDALVDTYVERGYPLTIASAARLGRIEQLGDLLEDGGDPHRAAPDGRSPLQLAIENNQPEAVQVLLAHGVAADAPLSTWDRRTPLHEAASRADPGIADLLLVRGADANKLDRVGRSPLYDAVSHGRTETVRLLLEAGADPNRAPAGEALIDIAGRDEIRRLLESHGARSAADSPTH